MRSLVRGAVVVLVSLYSVSMYAALSQKYVDWAKSPVKWFMTRDEQKQWKSITTDEQAEAFIDLFWARRDPTPGTFPNEFKQEYEARVKFAKENFGHRQVPGELSDQGHAVILLGFPTNMATQFKQQSIMGGGGTGPANEQSDSGGGFGQGTMMGDRYNWVWERDIAQKYGMPRIEAVYIKDPISGLVQRDTQRNEIALALARAADLSVVDKSMTVAPEWSKRPPTDVEFVQAKTGAEGAAAVRTGPAGVHSLVLVKDAMALAAPGSGKDPFAGVKSLDTFTSSDDLGYAFEYCGASDTLKMTISIRGNANGEKVNMTAPLEDVPVESIKVVPGCSLVRASIPLSDMKVAAGQYTFSIKLEDGAQHYDLAQDFKVQ